MFYHLRHFADKAILSVYIFSFSIFLFLSAGASAQVKDSISTSDSTLHAIEVGVSGGLSLNQFTKSQPQTGYNTGYSAGIFLNYQLYYHFSLQLEINALQQGGQLVHFKDDTELGLPATIDYKNVTNSSYAMNSIEIPLLLHYTFNIHQSWKPSVYAGGSYAYTYQVIDKYQETCLREKIL